MRYPRLLILALAIVVIHSQMTFNVNSANYQVISGYWSLNIPVSGGVLPLTYAFQTLPSNWIQSGNLIQIPATVAAVGGTWAVRTNVTDSLGNNLLRSLLIKINEGSVYIADFPYNQAFSLLGTPTKSFSSGQSAFIPFSFSPSSSSSTTTNNVNVFGKPTSTGGVIPLQSQGSGVNTVLPTRNQLDSLIDSGDIVSITQIVQQVIASTLTCTQKSSYLYDFLGNIQSYISIKGSQAGQLKNIITNSQAKIALLNNQIGNYTSSINSLNLPNLQKQLQVVLGNLQTAYNSFNAANVDLTPYNLNITSNLQSINSLSQTLDTTTQQLQADNASLVNNQILIANLQKQLAAAQGNGITLEARILQETNSIAMVKGQIDALNANNIQLNNQINTINAKAATLQANYRSLENQAENLKNTIAANQAQLAQYSSQISLLKSQLQHDTANTDPNNLNAVLATIANLNSTIPTLGQQIDFVKFNCNGAVNYTVRTINGTITYTFATSTFSTYVTNEYGLPSTNAAQAQIGPISNVALTPINIFSPSYVNLYGSSFATELQSINSTNAPSNYQFTSDFSCSSSQSLVSQSGVVKAIDTNLFTVALSNGTIVYLTLGACSNIMILNSLVPKVGNTIYWKGNQFGNSYQVISALCF